MHIYAVADSCLQLSSILLNPVQALLLSAFIVIE